MAWSSEDSRYEDKNEGNEDVSIKALRPQLVVKLGVIGYQKAEPDRQRERATLYMTIPMIKWEKYTHS